MSFDKGTYPCNNQCNQNMKCFDHYKRFLCSFSFSVNSLNISASKQTWTCLCHYRLDQPSLEFQVNVIVFSLLSLVSFTLHSDCEIYSCCMYLQFGPSYGRAVRHWIQTCHDLFTQLLRVTCRVSSQEILLYSC